MYIYIYIYIYIFIYIYQVECPKGFVMRTLQFCAIPHSGDLLSFSFNSNIHKLQYLNKF